MENKRVFASITEVTLTAARDRVLDALNELTNGEADRALRYAAEFNELDGILREHREHQKKLAERQAEAS